MVIMGHRKKHAPRHGSLAFLPRKRAASIKARVRHWEDNSEETNFLGFAGFKVGMSHVLYIEDQPNSPYYGKELMKSVTVVEVPPLVLIGVRVYKEDDYGKYIAGEIFTNEFNDFLARKVSLPNIENYDIKKLTNKILEDLDETCEIRGVFQTQPHKTSLPRKKPDIIEIKVNSSNMPKDELNFTLKNLGKEIRARDVLNEGELIDIIAVTKGKGFQGPVKRHGVKIRFHKSEKTKRGPGSLGPWHGPRTWKVPHAVQKGQDGRRGR